MSRWVVADVTCDPGVRWVGEASSAQDALEQARILGERTRVPAAWHAQTFDSLPVRHQAAADEWCKAVR